MKISIFCMYKCTITYTYNIYVHPNVYKRKISTRRRCQKANRDLLILFVLRYIWLSACDLSKYFMVYYFRCYCFYVYILVYVCLCVWFSSWVHKSKSNTKFDKTKKKSSFSSEANMPSLRIVCIFIKCLVLVEKQVDGWMNGWMYGLLVS